MGNWAAVRISFKIYDIEVFDSQFFLNFLRQLDVYASLDYISINKDLESNLTDILNHLKAEFQKNRSDNPNYFWEFFFNESVGDADFSCLDQNLESISPEMGKFSFSGTYSHLEIEPIENRYILFNSSEFSYLWTMEFPRVDYGILDPTVSFDWEIHVYDIHSLLDKIMIDNHYILLPELMYRITDIDVLIKFIEKPVPRLIPRVRLDDLELWTIRELSGSYETIGDGLVKFWIPLISISYFHYGTPKFLESLALNFNRVHSRKPCVGTICNHLDRLIEKLAYYMVLYTNDPVPFFVGLKFIGSLIDKVVIPSDQKILSKFYPSNITFHSNIPFEDVLRNRDLYDYHRLNNFVSFCDDNIILRRLFSILCAQPYHEVGMLYLIVSLAKRINDQDFCLEKIAKNKLLSDRIKVTSYGLSIILYD